MYFFLRGGNKKRRRPRNGKKRQNTIRRGKIDAMFYSKSIELPRPLLTYQLTYGVTECVIARLTEGPTNLLRRRILMAIFYRSTSGLIVLHWLMEKHEFPNQRQTIRSRPRALFKFLKVKMKHQILLIMAQFRETLSIQHALLMMLFLKVSTSYNPTWTNISSHMEFFINIIEVFDTIDHNTLLRRTPDFKDEDELFGALITSQMRQIAPEQNVVAKMQKPNIVC